MKKVALYSSFVQFLECFITESNQTKGYQVHQITIFFTVCTHFWSRGARNTQGTIILGALPEMLPPPHQFLVMLFNYSMYVQDQYGNYIIQHILDRGSKEEIDVVVQVNEHSTSQVVCKCEAVKVQHFLLPRLQRGKRPCGGTSKKCVQGWLGCQHIPNSKFSTAYLFIRQL